jgi:hypothetical protein
LAGHFYNLVFSIERDGVSNSKDLETASLYIVGYISTERSIENWKIQPNPCKSAKETLDLKQNTIRSFKILLQDSADATANPATVPPPGTWPLGKRWRERAGAAREKQREQLPYNFWVQTG